MFEKFFSVIESFIGRVGLTAITGTAAAATAGLVTKKVTEEGVVALNPLAIAGAGVAGVALVEGARFFATDAETLRSETLKRHGIDLDAVKSQADLTALILSAERRAGNAAAQRAETVREDLARIADGLSAQTRAMLEMKGELLGLAGAVRAVEADVEAIGEMVLKQATAEQAAAAPALAAAAEQAAAAPAKKSA